MTCLRDLTGIKFGNQQVLKSCLIFEKPYLSRFGKTYWLVKCICGSIRSVSADDLINRGHISCFACRSNNSLPYGEANFNYLYDCYKRNNAEKRQLCWKLTKEEFRKIVQQPCKYCASLSSNKMKAKKMNGEFTYNGIDRKDNTKGYTKENCVPCCKICNSMKSKLSEKEFLEQIEKIYKKEKKEKDKKNLK